MDAGQVGQPGQLSDTPALGGDGPGSAAGPGGNGGAGTQAAGDAAPGADDAGGGGGAVGRIRINADGTPTVDGLVSPAQATGAFTIGALPLASS